MALPFLLSGAKVRGRLFIICSYGSRFILNAAASYCTNIRGCFNANKLEFDDDKLVPVTDVVLQKSRSVNKNTETLEDETENPSPNQSG